MRLKIIYTKKKDKVYNWEIVRLKAIAGGSDGSLMLGTDTESNKKFIEINPNKKALAYTGESSTRCFKEVKDLKEMVIEIGNRSYQFLDFSEEEIQELIEGEGLE